MTSMAAKLQLYCYWISSCAHRVRIALGLKGLDFEYKPVNLSKNEQSDPEFEKINPVKYVPVLVDGDVVIADSLAIILYLEDKYPQFPLLPRDDLRKKALNLQVASIVGSSIQPLLNIPAHSLITGKFTSDEAIAWAEHHISRGFAAIEKLLEGCAGRYATGDEIQLADVFLAPQIYAGLARFKVDMSQFPTLLRLHEAYTEHPVFQASDPKRQPDAPFSA